MNASIVYGVCTTALSGPPSRRMLPAALSSSSNFRENMTTPRLHQRPMTLPAPSGALRVLIADDEPAARDKLTRLLGAHADVVVAGTASNGIEAARAIRDL